MDKILNLIYGKQVVGEKDLKYLDENERKTFISEIVNFS